MKQLTERTELQWIMLELGKYYSSKTHEFLKEKGFQFYPGDVSVIYWRVRKVKPLPSVIVFTTDDELTPAALSDYADKNYEGIRYKGVWVMWK